jgi:hypothetical protein
MNKKIHIGSIVAGAILIGVSFTSVVGYRGVASDVQASPLFNIRSSRAIDEESEELSCEYVGKGDYINLLILNRKDKTILLQNFIERICKMGDKTFNKYFGLIFSRIKQNSIDEKKIVIVLNQLKNIQEINESISLLSWNNPCTIGAWFPGCWIINIIITFVDSIHTLLLWLKNIRNSISYILPGCCETWN